MSFNKIKISECILTANTGADAIKRAPIVDEDTGVRCIRIGDISNNKPFEEWGFTSADDNIISKFGLKEEDILVARTGNTIGVVKYIECNLNSVYNNGLIRVKVDKEKYFPKYIYYNLISNEFKSFINSISAGTSTQPNMKINDMLRYEILNLDLNEQKAIAKILSDLDDKIEVNNKINKNLEDMAQAIFKHWFVDFEFPNEEGKPYKSSGGEMVDSELGMIPKGWEVKELSEVFTFKKGKKPKEILEKKENEDYKKYLTIDVLNQNSELFALPEKLVECLNDETLMVMDGASSGTIYTGMSGIVGSTLAKLEAKDNSYKTFIFNFLKYREFDIKSHLTGSAIPHADKNYINAIKVALPKEKEVLLNLSNTLRLIMEKIRINKLENKKLNALRDVLLPKLMSGEIRVSID